MVTWWVDNLEMPALYLNFRDVLFTTSNGVYIHLETDHFSLNETRNSSLRCQITLRGDNGY